MGDCRRYGDGDTRQAFGSDAGPHPDPPDLWTGPSPTGLTFRKRRARWCSDPTTGESAIWLHLSGISGQVTWAR